MDLPMKNVDSNNLIRFKVYLTTEQRISLNTAQRYCHVLGAFLRKHSFTEEAAKSFIIEKEAHYTEACANHYAKAFRHYGRFIGADWTQTIKVVEEHPEDYELLTNEEVWRLIKLKPYPHKYSVYFLLMVATGRRGGELRKLKRSDISGSFIRFKSKTKEKRRCAIGQQVQEILTQYLASFPQRTAYLFTNKQGTPVTNAAVNKEFKKRLQTLGITKNTRVHDLRAHYINRQIKNNPLSHVQYQVGHKRLTTTQRYVHPDDADLLNLTQHDVLFRENLSGEEYLSQFVEIANKYGILTDSRFRFIIGSDRLEIYLRQ